MWILLPWPGWRFFWWTAACTACSLWHHRRVLRPGRRRIRQGAGNGADAVADKTTRSGRPIQLLAGCSHITTREVIRLIKLVEQVGGYDAVSVLTPMFISQTQEELYTHYRTIAESTTMPVLMYNNPQNQREHRPGHGGPPGP